MTNDLQELIGHILITKPGEHAACVSVFSGKFCLVRIITGASFNMHFCM